MNVLYTGIAGLLFFCFSLLPVYAQQGNICIKFIGNCGLYLSDGQLNLYVDFPYRSGAFNYMKYGKTELDSIKSNALFIFTHRHPDHYSGQLLKKQTGQVLGPWKVPKGKRADLNQLKDSFPYFSVQAFRTKHRFASRHSSYLLSWHGKRIFLSGDTERAETIAGLKDIDIAFVPYWILLDAREKNMQTDVKKFFVYHLYPEQKLNVSTPERIQLLQRQGEVICIPFGM